MGQRGSGNVTKKPQERRFRAAEVAGVIWESEALLFSGDSYGRSLVRADNWLVENKSKR